MTESETEILTLALITQYRPEGFRRGHVCQVIWGRAVAALGRARSGPFGVSITYSRPLWAAMPEHEQRDTVIHEVAHLLTIDDYLRTPGSAKPAPHGREWQAWMRRMGGQPRAACKDASVAAAARVIRAERAVRRADSVTLRCNCALPHTVTLKRAGRPLVCRRCRAVLRGVGYEGLAVLLAQAASGRPTLLPPGAAERAQSMQHWPARSVLRMAQELYADVPQAEITRLGLD